MIKKTIIIFSSILSIIVLVSLYTILCVHFSDVLVEDRSNKYIDDCFYLYGNVIEKNDGIYKVEVISYYQNKRISDEIISEYKEFMFDDRSLVFVSYDDYISNKTNKVSKKVIFNNLFNIEIRKETIANYKSSYDYNICFEKHITTVETNEELNIGSNYYFDVSNNGIEMIDQNFLFIKENETSSDIQLLGFKPMWYVPDYVYKSYKPIKVSDSLDGDFISFNLD